MDINDLNKGVDTSNPWKTITYGTNGKADFESEFGLKVYTDKVIDPRGNGTTYTYVVKPDFVCVVVVNQDNEVYLVGQYRYPLKEYTWEVIKGGVDTKKGDKSFEDAAKRETKEETGLVVSNITPLQKDVIMGANKTYRGNLFLVQGIDSQGETDFDASENITAKKVPFTDAVKMVLAGEIHDGFSSLAILQAAAKLGVIKLV